MREEGYYWVIIKETDSFIVGYFNNESKWLFHGESVDDVSYEDSKLKYINGNRIKAPYELSTLIEDSNSYSFPLRADVTPIANTTEIPKNRIIDFSVDSGDVWVGVDEKTGKGIINLDE